jgi:ATP-dependent DNA helicase RecQ
MIDKATKLEKLKNIWGFSTFRGDQEKIIDHVISGKDCLVIMPTGGGKSLCYQLPALLSPGLTVVVSPLIALMNDQVTALRQSGVKVAALHSNILDNEVRQIMADIESGLIKLLYVSPERINNNRFVSYLSLLKIDLVAIDEAHCVSVWGNDFRPDYMSLHILRDALPSVPFIALTATADHATQTDICAQLHLHTPEIFLSSFERNNITTYVLPAENRLRKIIDVIRNKPNDSGIIYCLSRKETESMADNLRVQGYKAKAYHAGMDGQSRTAVQIEFQEDKLSIVCATIAFGMGIDKPNIRWVIHYSMPKNLEGYYQEIGRAGRDGKPAMSLLFYNWGDYLKLKRFIDDSPAEEQFKDVQYAKLDRMWEFASASDCRTNVVLNYFGEYRTHNCSHCDNCIDPPQLIDGTVVAQKALSAVKRCNENVSMGLLIDILRGSYRAEVRDGGYDRVKTFGVGKDISFINWKIYITQLINQGYLKIDYTHQFKLKTTPLSDDVLFSGKKVNLVDLNKIVHEMPTKKREKKISKKELFELELGRKLIEWRTQIATNRGIPSYTILTDEVIERIAKDCPLFKPDLASIEGMGTAKLTEYGADLLAVIHGYVQSQEHYTKVKGSTYMDTLIKLKQNRSIETIAKEKEVSISTIYAHLAYLYIKGEDIDIMKYVTVEEVERVYHAWISVDKSLEIGPLVEKIKTPMELHKIKLALAVIIVRERKTNN